MKASSLLGIAAVVAVASAAALAQTGSSAPPKAPPAAKAPSAQAPSGQGTSGAAQALQPSPAPAQVIASCDVACIRASADRAVPACAPRIEAAAPGDYEWLLRPYGSIFQEADPPEEKTPTVVRYRGDSIRFLSPQKEWVRAIYECGFDAAKLEVAYVRVQLGVRGKARAVPEPPAPPPQAQAPKPVPGQVAQGQAAPAAATPAVAAPTSDRRKVGEPDTVSVKQVKPPKDER